MKPHIPHPLGMSTKIEVMTIAPPWSATVLAQVSADEFEEVDLRAFEGLTDADATCRPAWQRGHLATDLVTVASPRWVAWAVAEALSGRVPRTMCYLAPVLTGGGAWDLGRGPVALPMQFGGEWCHPDWPDGQGCDDPDMAALPYHEGLTPRRRHVVEEVLLDDFESMGWPAIRAPGGAA